MECGKAIELASNNINKYSEKLVKLRNYYIEQIFKKIPKAKLNGGIENRLPGNANISFVGIDKEAILYELDKRGICASAGSACSSGFPEPSHVLQAIGCTPEQIASSLRISFGEENTKEDVDYLIKSIEEIVNKYSPNN